MLFADKPCDNQLVSYIKVKINKTLKNEKSKLTGRQLVIIDRTEEGPEASQRLI